MNRCRRCDFDAQDRDELAEHARESGHSLCICCARSLDEDSRQTCIWCLGRARRDLITIVELCALLPDQALNGGGTSFEPVKGTKDTAIPGGEALVLMSPGSRGLSALWDIAAGGRGEWADDESDADPQPPLALLATWEDDWRIVKRQPAGGPATLSSVSSWLADNLAWAADHHAAFDEFAKDLSKCRARLEGVLRHGPQRSPVPCMTCGHRSLERPQPDGKRKDEILWQCGHCHRRYTPKEYYLACREHKSLLPRQPEQPDEEVKAQRGRRPARDDDPSEPNYDEAAGVYWFELVVGRDVPDPAQAQREAERHGVPEGLSYTKHSAGGLHVHRWEWPAQRHAS